MKILSFSHYSVKMIGGHRPYNIDKALLKKGVEMTQINNWAMFSFRPSGRKVFASEQREREKIFDTFVESGKKDAYIMLHGPFFPEKFMKKLVKTGIPTIMDFRDDPILQSEMLGVDINKKNAMANIKAAFEYSELILFPSETLKNYYPEISEKAVTIMNAGDPDHFRFSPLPNNHHVVSLMTSAPCYMYDTLLEACIQARKNITDLQIHLRYLPEKNVGDFMQFSNEIRKKYNFDWVHYFESIPYDQIFNFLSQFQLNAISVKKGKYSDSGLPLKLFDSMAMGRPVVITNCTEMGKIVRETDCGLTFEFTAEDLSEKIQKVLDNPNLAQKMGENGRKAIETKHSWDHRADEILMAISKILS